MPRLSRNDLEPVEDVLLALQARLPTGRHFAIRGRDLAVSLGVDPRTVRELVNELIERGWLVGSTCDGYFLCGDMEDVDVGTAHLRSRARAMFARVARLRASAEEMFGEPVLTLFDLEEISA